MDWYKISCVKNMFCYITNFVIINSMLEEGELLALFTFPFLMSAVRVGYS